ncbi:MAG TPA: hypothetical protein VKZ53_28500 [Candidatus Angelobacter sp.]|nr:hypothetical protein [Candidatus Angelobacter sp.]
MAAHAQESPLTVEEKRQALILLTATGGPFDDHRACSKLFRSLLRMEIDGEPVESFRRTNLATKLRVTLNQLAVRMNQIRTALKSRYSALDLQDAVLVNFPRGSYRPEFERRDVSSELDEELRFSIESWDGPRVLEKVIDPLEEKARRGSLSILELASLAAAYCEAAYWGENPASEFKSRAVAVARRAVDISDGSNSLLISTAHFGHACVTEAFERKFAAADKEFAAALKICPTNAFARAAYTMNVLVPGRRFEEAHDQATLSVSGEPKSPYTHSTLGWVLFFLKRYDLAIDRWHKALHFFKTAFSPRYGIACASGEKTDWDTCFATFAGMLDDWPEQQYITALLAHYKARANDQNAAREILRRLMNRKRKPYVSPYAVAIVHAGLGEVAETFQWLDEAYREGDIRLAYLDVMPFWKILRADPRYQALCLRLGLPQYERIKRR